MSVTVVRNGVMPVINETQVSLTLQETMEIGQEVYTVTASDSDKVSLF